MFQLKPHKRQSVIFVAKGYMDNNINYYFSENNLCKINH